MIDLDTMRRLVGLHTGIPEPVYRSWPAVNFSTYLKKHRSMAHLHYAASNPAPAKKAQTFGIAYHMAVFESKRFAKEVAIAPSVDRRTKDGKAAWAEFLAKSEGMTIIEEDEAFAIGAMMAALNAHPTIRKLIGAEGPCEAAVVWIDEETQLPCKARLDKFLPGVLALDLKSTTDASPVGWPFNANRWNYDQQAAHYYDGFSTVAEPTPFCFIAQESEPPYAAALWTPDDETVAVGRTKNRAALRRIAECVKSGVWPGYSEKVERFRLPEWAMNTNPEGLPKVDDAEHPF